MADIKEYIEAIKGFKGDILSDEGSLGIYATDASVYQIKPLLILIPKDEVDVSLALKAAREKQLPILPRGGGTSLAGQTVGRSLILDFSKYMNEILELNVEDQWVRVQPGLVRDVLNDFLQPHGLHFAPDPATSSRANIGGMVGNNSSGTKSIIYGKTVDHVLEARVMLADGNILELKELTSQQYHDKCLQQDREGEIYRKFKALIAGNEKQIKERFPDVMRRVGGYNLDEFIDTQEWNLSKIITGSEGTLATTLEVKLNLEPLPKHKSVAVVHFHKLIPAIEAVATMLEFNPSAVEILDKTVIDLSRENLTTKRSCHFIEGNPEAILIVEFYSEDGEEVMRKAQSMVERLQTQRMGYAWPLFPDGPEYEDVWIIRKKGLGLMLGLKGEKKPLPFIEDAGIPVKVLPAYIDRVLKICEKYHTRAAMYAHASVGVIHVRPILDLRQSEDIERFHKIAGETFQLVMEYKGSWSGEHGDGLVRSAFNRAYFGDQIYGAFKELKRLFDPDNLMNPGKIVDAPAMTENLRYGKHYRDEPVETVYRYRSENSFGEAVHMCTGVGECRKLIGGTMCPSFKATRDEEHSTRGRANALRLAMSGQLDAMGLSSERVRKTLDLCLSCKACKSECPSNVDLAKLKSEVSQIYFDKNGVSLRDRLIRNSSAMAASFSGTLAPVVNAIQHSRGFRKLMEVMAGFDSRRKLPLYAPEPFHKWYERNTVRNNNGKKVALFADTYLNYHEPQVGVAAYELLTACGYEVMLAHVGCCQRPRISHGFLRDAAKDGLQTLKGLDELIRKDIPVVVCEPSCASALTDDLPDLIADEALSERLKHHIFMIDQFLEKAVESGSLPCGFDSTEQDVLIHGHCHQKALYGTKALKTIFSKVEGLRFGEIDSGCCGMAGSFGYEKEHYDLSQKIGAQILFPAIRENNSKSVVANGFSCRHQIDHFTGRKAKHWVEIIKAKPLNK